MFFFLLIGFGAKAQKISKYYTSNIQENGVLYFIEPKKEFKTIENSDPFIYDLTYLSSKDSVTFNFTIQNQKIIVLKKLALQIGAEDVVSKTNLIFVEEAKKEWNHRYSATFSFHDLAQFYQEKQVTFLLQSTTGLFTIKPKEKEWKKQSAILSRIFSMIAANK